MKQVNAGIVGAGHIGSELYKRITSLGWNVHFVLKTSGVYSNLEEKVDELENYRQYIKNIDVAFLAIPTLDDGKTAADYIFSFLCHDIPIVTCEKGAMSNYFYQLKKSIDLNMLGYSATVGGGTRLLRYIAERNKNQVEEIHAVLNGTLNYIFTEVSSGRSLGEVVEETKKLGYAEPGAVNPLDVINKEACDDIPMKTSILFNILNLTEKNIKAKDIETKKISEHELKQLIRESNNRRYIVSITKEDNGDNIIGGFKHQIGDWHISAGFKNIYENPLFIQLIPSGVNNAILVSEGKYGLDGTYVLRGQGAGAGPTTASMIKDAVDILERKNSKVICYKS